MPYIGNPISIGNLTQETFNGNATIYTLSYSVGSNASIAVYISGVHQVPTTDYSVSGTTLTFTSTTPAGTANISVTFLSLPISLPVPGDGTVTDAKITAMATTKLTGTVSDAQIAGMATSKLTGTIADSQIAAMTSSKLTGALPAISGAALTNLSDGGWQFVSSSTASSSATIEFTGFDAGFDYEIDMTNVTPATDTAVLKAELGVTGPTYRTANYSCSASAIFSNATSGSSGIVTAYIALIRGGLGSAADEKTGLTFTILNPNDASDTFFRGYGASHDSGTTLNTTNLGGFHAIAEAMTAIKIYMSSGNIATGVFNLYKRANA